MTERETSDALVADTLAHTDTHYMVIDIGGKPNNLYLIIHASGLCLSVDSCFLACLLREKHEGV